MRIGSKLAGLALIGGLAGTMVIGGAGPSLAHEARHVGSFHVAVGFGEEPAYAGQLNSVQMFLNDANDQPVVDLGDTLKVQVAFGDRKMDELTMAPNFEVGEFGTPGDYRAFFFPTRPGVYSFHLTGAIKGQKVDETFTSGPTTFDEVKDPAEVEFPVQDPSTGQLAERLGREVPRLQAAIDTASRHAKDEASSAKLVGLVGISVGALGLIVATVALLRKPRAT